MPITDKFPLDQTSAARGKPGKGAFGAVLILALGTLLSRMLGLVRDMLFAILLGPAADAFLVAFRLPNMARRLLAEGSLGLAYGVAASRMLAAWGPQKANAFAVSVLLRTFAAAVAVALLVAIFAGPLVWLAAPGLEPGLRAESARLLRLCAPYLPCALVAAIACAHCAALGRFRPQALSSAIFNALLIAVSATLLFGPQASLPSLGAGEILCFGVLLAGFAQAGAALGTAASGCAALRPDAGHTAFASDAKATRSDAIRELWAGPDPAKATALLRSLPRDMAGAAPHVMHLLAATIMASFLIEGGVSALYFAERLIELPLGLFGAAPGFAALPGLAAMAAAKDYDQFSANLGRNLRLTAFFSLPATAGLFALDRPICGLLFGHGAYDDNAVATTATVLYGFCLGLPALCASRPLLAAANALGCGNAALRAAVLSLVPLVLPGAAGLLFWGNTGKEAGLCLGLGLAAGAWSNALLLLRTVKRAGLPSPLAGHIPTLGAYTLGAVCMGAVLLPLRTLTGHTPAWGLPLLIALSAGLWAGCALLLGSDDALRIWRKIRKT